MAATVSINNGPQMNTPMSIVLSIPTTATTIIIQLPFNHQQDNGPKLSENVENTDDVIFLKEEKPEIQFIKTENVENTDDVIFLKEVKPEIQFIKQEKHETQFNINDIRYEEFNSNFDIDERMIQNDINLNAYNIFSPISITDSDDIQRRTLSTPEFHLPQSFEDISEIIQFLQADMY